MADSSQPLSISFWSIMKVVLVVIGLWLLYVLRDILLLFFIALIFASAIEEWVDWLYRRKVPRIIGVLLLYLILFGFASALFALLFPPLVEQLRALSIYFPQALQRLGQGISELSTNGARPMVGEEIGNFLGSLSELVSPAAGGFFTYVTSIVGGVVSLVLVLIITLYIVVERTAITAVLKSLVPDQHFDRVHGLIIKVQKRIGLWLKGQLLLGLIIGIMAYIGLVILGIPNALALALFAGLTELIPILGPIIGAIPAVVLALAVSPVQALLVVGLYVLIQQLENHLIVPQVMRRAAGVNPLVSIFALLAGARLGGIAGALLAVPVATAITAILEDLFPHRKDHGSVE